MKDMGVFPRKLPNGKVVYYLVYTDKNGKRRWKSLKTSNKREAQRIAREIQKLLEEKQSPSSVTLSRFAAEYFSWLAETRSRETVITYRAAWKKFAEFVGENRRLSQITTRDIDLWVKHETHKGNKPTTTNKDIRSLKAIFAKAVEWGYLKENPFSGYKMLPAENEKIRYLSEAEIKRLFSVIKDEKFRLFVAFALYSGCRRGEILELTWDCVDWKNEVIRMKNLKTKKPKFVPLTPALKTVLTKMQQYTQVGYVFPRWHPSTVSHKFKKYARMAGLDCRFHDLRHTYATYLVIKGVPINVVKELVGHTNLSTTMIYLHAAEDIKKKAASQMDVALEVIKGEKNRAAKC